MGRGQGRIGLFTIASIFVVVFALMYGGVQYANGELLPDRTLSDEEHRIKAALWGEIDELRTDADRPAAIRSGYHDVAAQGTAIQLANADRAEAFAGGISGPGADSAIPNGGPFCSQMAVAVSDETGSSDRIADQALRNFTTIDGGREVLLRGDGYVNGIGVVRSGADVYVVYRSCAIKTP